MSVPVFFSERQTVHQYGAELQALHESQSPAAQTQLSQAAPTPDLSSSVLPSQQHLLEPLQQKFFIKAKGQTKWDTMFNRLLKFKEKHGNCLVPNRYEELPQLGSWVSTQRRQYKQYDEGIETPLTKERVALLNNAGFVWKTKDPRHVDWDVRFNELLQYKNEYGDCLVPIGFKGNTQLSNWVSTQRQEFKLLKDGKPSRLDPQTHADRIKKLNDIGFVWEAQRGGSRKKRPRKDVVSMNDWDNLVPEGVDITAQHHFKGMKPASNGDCYNAASEFADSTPRPQVSPDVKHASTIDLMQDYSVDMQAYTGDAKLASAGPFVVSNSDPKLAQHIEGESTEQHAASLVSKAAVVDNNDAEKSDTVTKEIHIERKIKTETVLDKSNDTNVVAKPSIVADFPCEDELLRKKAKLKENVMKTVAGLTGILEPSSIESVWKGNIGMSEVDNDIPPRDNNFMNMSVLSLSTKTPAQALEQLQESAEKRFARMSNHANLSMTESVLGYSKNPQTQTWKQPKRSIIPRSAHVSNDSICLDYARNSLQAEGLPEKTSLYSIQTRCAPSTSLRDDIFDDAEEDEDHVVCKPPSISMTGRRVTSTDTCHIRGDSVDKVRLQDIAERETFSPVTDRDDLRSRSESLITIVPRFKTTRSVTACDMEYLENDASQMAPLQDAGQVTDTTFMSTMVGRTSEEEGATVRKP